MPTNKQRREAAQRHLQRQLERRAELAKKRRRNLGIVAAAVAAAGGRRRGAADHRRLRRRRRRRSAAAAAPRRRPRPRRRRADTNADGTWPAPTPRRLGQPESHRRRHAARRRRRRRPRAPATLTMSDQPGRHRRSPWTGRRPRAPPASFTYLAEQELLRRHPVPPVVNQPRPSGAAVRRPERHRQRRPELPVRRGGHPRDDLPARHHRDGQQRQPGSTGSQFFLVFGDSPAQPGLHRRRHHRRGRPRVLDTDRRGGNDGSFEARRRRRRPDRPGRRSSR